MNARKAPFEGLRATVITSLVWHKAVRRATSYVY